MTNTRRDPNNHNTIIALAHLLGAKDAREQYDQLLQRAIASYGDRHMPTRQSGDYAVPSPGSGCDQCDRRGHQYDRLNHQTGAPIAGIYADHFPDQIKQQLRFYASLITWQTDHAILFWRKAGRRASTLWPFMNDARMLANGRRSYY